MKKPSRKYLTRELDKIWQEIIKKSGCCIKCGKKKNLQAAHLFSRSMRSVRWDIDNGLPLCAGCHFWAHKQPILFAEFTKLVLGSNRYEELKRKAIKIKQWKIHELQDLLKQLKSILS